MFSTGLVGNEPELDALFVPQEIDLTTPSSKGHYLLNRFGQVSARFGRSKKIPRNFQDLLQNVCARNPKSQVSLAYFEGMLFPYIFPFQEEGSVIGALPHSMFIRPLMQRKYMKGIATLNDHMMVRSTDFSSVTSSEPDYSAFGFDVNVNEKLNYNHVMLGLKKGPEFLMKPRGDGLDVGQKETGMFDNKVENHGPVNELSAFIKKMGKSDYFMTLTCNQERTPGVCTIIKKVRKVSAMLRLSAFEYKALMTGVLPILLHTWNRTVRYIWRWISHGSDKPCGPVKAIWYRYANIIYIATNFDPQL